MVPNLDANAELTLEEQTDMCLSLLLDVINAMEIPVRWHPGIKSPPVSTYEM